MKALKWLDKNFEKVILVFLLVMIAAVMMFYVIARYVFGTGMSWTDELTRSSFIIMVFLGTSYSIRENIFFRMATLIDSFGPKGRFAMELVMDVCLIAFFGYFTYHAFGTAEFYGVRGTLTLILYIPQLVMYRIYAACFILCTLRMVQKLVLDIKKGWRVYEGRSQKELDVESAIKEGASETLADSETGKEDND